MAFCSHKYLEPTAIAKPAIVLLVFFKRIDSVPPKDFISELNIQRYDDALEQLLSPTSQGEMPNLAVAGE